MLKLLWIFGLSFWFPVTGLSLLCTVHQWSSEYSWKIQGKEVTILHILEIKLLLACGYIWCSTESIINHYLFNHIYIYIYVQRNFDSKFCKYIPAKFCTNIPKHSYLILIILMEFFIIILRGGTNDPYINKQPQWEQIIHHGDLWDGSGVI